MKLIQVSARTVVSVACIEELPGGNLDHGVHSALTEALMALLSPSTEVS
jgi:hypothetical protein